MVKEIEFAVRPEDHKNSEQIHKLVVSASREKPSDISGYYITRRSIDARSKNPVYRFRALVFVNEPVKSPVVKPVYLPARGDKRVIIVGAGPGGLFAALRLLESGIKPIILERGKDVQARRRDLRAIMQEGSVNPDSNYCFGEGGAGTYSDGKLYTRSDKRGNILKVLNVFVMHGADPDILIDAHPHIGSNKLPKIIEAMRNTILEYGGEIHFNSRVTGLIRSGGGFATGSYGGGSRVNGVGSGVGQGDTVTGYTEKNDSAENKGGGSGSKSAEPSGGFSNSKTTGGNRLKGVIVNNSTEFFGDAVILATGHSARDIYEMLVRENIMIEPKPFALGVRIEHPQTIIDQAMYHQKNRGEFLPAASYSLACQISGRGAYSFCMCPGGVIIPASTAPGELVLNGMSVSRRDSPYANSGFVVEVRPEDWERFAEDHNVGQGTNSGFVVEIRPEDWVRFANERSGSFSDSSHSRKENRERFAEKQGGVYRADLKTHSDDIVEFLRMGKNGTPENFTTYGALAALHYQKSVEARVWEAGGKTQTAPAQRVTDFLNGKVSTSLPATSYIPGVTSVDLKGVLPAEITIRLKEALKIFNSKLKGYITDEAIMLATESRTSSPVRIPRDRITKTHPQISNLYPCAEGAGYAGGIVSAAIDGDNISQQIIRVFSNSR
ncbi:MAG: hypothetical protein F9K26_04245 [Ignavibacteriaceae bacterium]|nr:MAG: hypothetical protein F9K26_04245 [Ignavibacteriaceae bacterium]MBV6444924.1 hypothetical protein [Ignavibacteriaceae bacterium]MBW7873498.1 FAD-dependent monooxygenase [Ignavibacteria bacterium]OQY70845.1 MAG: hypothetical protein B6D45_10775 [Ignavibacteriales bacterium UTCHB3]WKZ71613.1 MAG: FAD-dependent monooxygenase [Ignavibacteriaceae bacterium]